jgi:hypothetical protein
MFSCVHQQFSNFLCLVPPETNIWTPWKITKKNTQFNISFIQLSMALQPFVVPWPLLQFCNLFYTDSRIPWTSNEPITRPLPTHRTTQTQNKHTHRHPYLEWIQTHDPSVRANEDGSCLKPCGHCDQQFNIFSSLKI